MGKDNDRGFKVITAFIKPGFRLRFSPTIIGAENIPKDGAVVIAGNHKNISDQFLVFLATKRVVNYMAKREYFDGALAPLFRWAGCIPVNRDKNSEKGRRRRNLPGGHAQQNGRALIAV